MPGQKENLDPSILKKNLNRRRGSAPVAVALPPKTTTAQDDNSSTGFKTCDKFLRRGSMPTDCIQANNIDSALLQSDFLYTANVTIIQRRGSVPCENLSSTNRNNCNGKTKNRKKMLRRRSSGGAEILCPIVAESEPSSSGGGGGGSSSWYRFKRSEPSKNRSDLDMLLSRRRGSLPVEVLAVSHSGTLRH